jgi:hypothetical protein
MYKYRNFLLPAVPTLLKIFTAILGAAKTNILAGPSCVTGPAELNEMVQYIC